MRFKNNILADVSSETSMVYYSFVIQLAKFCFFYYYEKSYHFSCPILLCGFADNIKNQQHISTIYFSFLSEDIVKLICALCNMSNVQEVKYYVNSACNSFPENSFMLLYLLFFLIFKVLKNQAHYKHCFFPFEHIEFPKKSVLISI